MVLRLLLKSKIHRAIVTDSKRDYVGSLTIDLDLMEKADIWVGEQILVLDYSNGSRVETYAIAGDRGSRSICVNGPATHLIKKGDEVTIMAFALTSKRIRPRIVLVNRENRFERYL